MPKRTNQKKKVVPVEPTVEEMEVEEPEVVEPTVEEEEADAEEPMVVEEPEARGHFSELFDPSIVDRIKEIQLTSQEDVPETPEEGVQSTSTEHQQEAETPETGDAGAVVAFIRSRAELLHRYALVSLQLGAISKLIAQSSSTGGDQQAAETEEDRVQSTSHEEQEVETSDAVAPEAVEVEATPEERERLQRRARLLNLVLDGLFKFDIFTKGVFFGHEFLATAPCCRWITFTGTHEHTKENQGTVKFLLVDRSRKIRTVHVLFRNIEFFRMDAIDNRSMLILRISPTAAKAFLRVLPPAEYDVNTDVFRTLVIPIALCQQAGRLVQKRGEMMNEKMQSAFEIQKLMSREVASKRRCDIMRVESRTVTEDFDGEIAVPLRTFLTQHLGMTVGNHIILSRNGTGREAYA